LVVGSRWRKCIGHPHKWRECGAVSRRRWKIPHENNLEETKLSLQENGAQSIAPVV
jgi:hypothetical protein